MSDNLFYTQPATGFPVATDDVNGTHYQVMKLDVGNNGESIPVTGSIFGLPVDIHRFNVPLPAGTNNIGDVDVLTLPSLPAGNNNIGDVDIASLPALPAGTNTIGNVFIVGQPVGVSGTVTLGGSLPAGNNNIGDVDVASLPSLPAGSNLIGKVTIEGQPLGVSGTVSIGGSLPAGTNNIGDVDVLSLPSIPAGNNNIGDVDVASLPALPAGSNTIGNVFLEGQPIAVSGTVTLGGALPAGNNNIGDVDVASLPVLPTGNNVIGRVYLEGQPIGVSGTVSIGGSLPAGNNNIGDVDVASLPALPAGSNLIGKVNLEGQPIGVSGFVDVTPVSPSASDYLPVRLTDGSNFYVAGSSPGGSSVFQYVEGIATPSVTGDAIMWRDTGDVMRPVSAADPLPVDVISALPAGNNNIGDVDVASLPPLPAGSNLIGKVNLEGQPIGVSGTITIGGSLPAGTNNIGDVDVLTLPSIPAGNNNIGDVDVASLPPLPAGTNTIGNVFIEGQPVGVSGTVTLGGSLPAGNNNIGDVDVVSLPALPAGSNLIGKVNIEGQPIGVSGFVDVTPVSPSASDYLPVRLTDGSNFYTAGSGPGGSTVYQYVEGIATPSVTGDAIMWRDTGDVMRPVSAADPLPVDVISALPAGNNNIGDVDVASLPSIPAGSNLIGKVNIEGQPIGVSGTITVGGSLPAGTNNIGDVDVLTLPSIPAGSNLIGKVNLEGQPIGVSGFIDVTPASPSATDYLPVRLTDGSNFYTAGAGPGGSAAFQYVEGIATASVTGDAIMWRDVGDVMRPVSAADPLPVDIISALPAGTNNIGDVDVLTLPSLPAGSNTIGNVFIVGQPVAVSGTVTIGGSLPAGNNNIGDVDVVSTVPATNHTAGPVILGSPGEELRLDVQGCGTALVSVSGNFSGQINVFGVAHNFYSGIGVLADDGNPTRLNDITFPGNFIVPVAGWNTIAIAMAVQGGDSPVVSAFASPGSSIQAAVMHLASTRGEKGNNSAVPGADNFGVFPAVATNSAQSYSEGRQVALSVDLLGRLYTNIAAGSLNLAGQPIGVSGFVDVTPASPAAGDYLPVRLTDGGSFYTAGSSPGGGGGTEYAETTTTALATGGTVMWRDVGDVMRPVGQRTPLPTSLVALSGYISVGNSSTATLNGGVKFTGTSEEVTNYAEIQVNIFASHASAIQGVSGQFSSDGTNWDFTETWTCSGQSVQRLYPKARFFRLVYLNGGTNQTTFRLQTIYKLVDTQAQSTPNGRILIDGISYEVQQAPINATSSADNTVIAAVAGKRIRVLAITFTCGGAVDVAFKSGASTTLIAAMSFAKQGGPGLNLMPAGYFCQTNPGEAFVMNLSTATNVRGSLSYVLL